MEQFELTLEEKAERRRQRQREAARRWAKKNPEKARAKSRKSSAFWRERHAEACRAQARKRMLQHYHANKAELNRKRHLRDKRKMATDPQYALRRRLRNRISTATRRWLKDQSKGGSAVRDLGCTLGELITYLEELFEPGMSWSNYGRGGWHIDHRMPLAVFDLSNTEQFERAVHYTNLQPKWEADNLSKGSRLEPPTLW